jgi:hypothetical protein
VVRRFSEDQAADKIRDVELRVEVRNNVQKTVEPVVLRMGHLAASRHLDRFQPGDVGE